MAPIKINKEKGSFGSYLNPYGLARSSFQENRKGRVLGLYVTRPGLKNQVQAITV